MPQPHGGANADSGVVPQGYLLATEKRLFVPTGRAVPAAFRRSDGQLEYYRLQQNGSIGGARALVADRFVVNGGCFLERETGNLAARAGRGVFSVLPDGILQSTGKTLLAYRWADLGKPDGKGNLVRFRGLEKHHRIVLEDESAEERRAEKVIEKLPALRDLYRTEVRFKEVDYRTRPLINDDVIYAEGGAWKLKTDELVAWNFERSYGCGQIAGSAHLMVFRSATLGYLDLTRDVGTENFGGTRAGCWFNAIPAGGMVLVPDGSSKCACSYQLRAWLALQRREHRLNVGLTEQTGDMK